jgi:DNA polymerase III delta subunit
MMSAETTKRPASFTLIMGDDTLSREKARDDALAFAKDSGSEVVIERFDSGNQSLASFTERIITPSLFPATRFFLFRETHLFKKNDLDQLTELFSFDIPDVFVIFETDKTSARKGRGQGLTEDFGVWLEAFQKRVGEHPEKFSVVEYIMPPDYKMAQWVAARTPLFFNRSISPKDAEYFIECVGNDGSTLYSELQKLDVFLPPKKPIDRLAIEAVCGANRLMAPFELAQALGKKDFPRALEIIDSLFRGSVHVPLFVSAIFKHFWALFRISVYAGAHPEEMRKFTSSMKHYSKQVQDEIGLKIGVAAGLLSENQRSSVYPKIVKSNVVQQALSFTEEHYKKIFRWLGDYDVGIKTGRTDDDKTGFELLCYKIIRAGEVSD